VVLDYVVDYLKETGLLIKDETTSGFHDDFTDRAELAANLYNIFFVKNAFQNVRDQTCSFPEGIDSYSVCYLSQIEDCIVDMMLSESLGYNEQVIAKFKPFIEKAAVHAKINSIYDMPEFNARKSAFFYASILQVTEQLGTLGFEKDVSLDTKIKRIYDDFFGKAYDVDYASFLKGLKNQNFYYLSPNKEEASYSRTVKEAILTTIEPEHHEYVELLYSLSQDMSHASGYNFNSSPGLADVYCHVAMGFVWRYMVRLLLNIATTFDAHGKAVDFSVIIKNLSAMAEFENLTVEKISAELVSKAASHQ